mmetsp:Transcript_55836/g.109299  ORF Transcript_55836/g.109299 Transcript_55836/m.109299 type:complete len:214 (-) Transcript_55836:1914-2555(-)
MEPCPLPDLRQLQHLEGRRHDAPDPPGSVEDHHSGPGEERLSRGGIRPLHRRRECGGEDLEGQKNQPGLLHRFLQNWAQGRGRSPRAFRESASGAWRQQRFCDHGGCGPGPGRPWESLRGSGDVWAEVHEPEEAARAREGVRRGQEPPREGIRRNSDWRPPEGGHSLRSSPQRRCPEEVPRRRQGGRVPGGKDSLRREGLERQARVFRPARSV